MSQFSPRRRYFLCDAPFISLFVFPKYFAKTSKNLLRIPTQTFTAGIFDIPISLNKDAHLYESKILSGKYSFSDNIVADLLNRIQVEEKDFGAMQTFRFGKKHFPPELLLETDQTTSLSSQKNSFKKDSNVECEPMIHVQHKGIGLQKSKA